MCSVTLGMFAVRRETTTYLFKAALLRKSTRNKASTSSAASKQNAIAVMCCGLFEHYLMTDSKYGWSETMERGRR